MSDQTRFVGTVRKCDTGNQWCERKDYVCSHACERAVREKADAIIADATGLLSGLPHYAQHKWGMAESATGLYVKAADVKAALDTEQTMHAAWRKRAEEAERDLAAAQAVLPCGHHNSLMLKSAETGEPLYCELCDCISRRNDAETMEAEARAEAAAMREAIKDIGDFAHDRSTGPAVPDALWEIRRMAYTVLMGEHGKESGNG